MSLEDTQALAAPVESTPAPSPVEPAADSQQQGAEPSVDDELSKVWAKNNPARDPSGKFVARETSTPDTGASDAVVTDASRIEQPATEKTAEKPDAASRDAQTASPSPQVEPPRAWTAEQKALWAKLPPEVQPLIAQREAELQEIKTVSGRLAAEYKPLRDTLEQHKDYLSQIGMPPAQWLNQALAVSRALDTGHAAQVVKQLVETYAVDLGQIYDPLAAPPDPKVAALERELTMLRNEIASQRQASAASQQAAQAQTFESVVSEFMTKNPDAAEIEGDIAAEIQAIRTTEPNLDPAAMLAKAYERAAWANEKSRQRRIDALAAERVKAAEEARIAAAKEAAAKARTAAAVNVSGAPAPSAANDDPESLMRAVWRKNNQR